MKGVYFGTIHSYDDLNLVLSKANIPPAGVKTNYVDLPGGDGSVDLTEALGEIRYKDRECSFVFAVFPYDDFEEKKRQVSNLLNGKRFKIKLDKDSGYYYEGRCAVDEYASDRNMHTITVAATVAPYKLKTTETRVIVPAGTNVAVTLLNGRRKVAPTIICTAETKIVFNGSTYTIGAGAQKVLNIQLTMGENYMEITSAESVEFVYQEGDL